MFQGLNKIESILDDLLLRADEDDIAMDDFMDDSDSDTVVEAGPTNPFITDENDDVHPRTDKGEYVNPLVLHFHEDEDIDYFIREFLSDYTKGRMNRSQGRRMWRLFFRTINRLVKGRVVDGMSFETFERKVQENIPQPTVHWKVKRRDTDEIIRGQGRSFPEKRFADKDMYETLCVWTCMSLKELIRFHAALHPDANFIVNGKLDFSKVQLSFTYDGIPHSKSSSDNLTVMGLRFSGCKQVYIPNVRVAKRAEPKDIGYFLDCFIDECLELGVKVNFFLADAPMRSFIKCLKGHAGRHSCEYCLAAGECVMKRICYPASTRDKEPRTHEKWIDHVQDLEEQRQFGNLGHVKGVMGRSPLLRLNGFDIVKDAPSDPLHRDWLGIMKSTLWRHTVGITKVGVTPARGRKITELVSEVYRKVRLPSEFSHRSRPIDYPNFKGHEWKSLAITTFPTICEVVEREIDQQTAHVWLLFIFLVLVYNGPVWVRKRLGKDYLKTIHSQMYEEFEESFGQAACTFNWHSFWHMQEVSECGTPTQHSTEPYESAYGMVQVSFAPGTRNVGLQIVRNMMLRVVDHKAGQACKKHLRIEPERAVTKRDNSIVIDKYYNYYRVREVQGNDLAVQKILTKKWESPIDVNVPMSLVGVRKYNGLAQRQSRLSRDCVKGKGVLAEGKVLVPMYWDLLFS